MVGVCIVKFGAVLILALTVKEITAAELLVKSQGGSRQNLIIVDCRDNAEQKVSIIPGAVPKKHFETMLETDSEAVKAKEVVAYCTIGYRSGLYAKKLGSKGIAASNLKGSMLAWTHEGGELVDLTGVSTRNVHTYGRRWDLTRSGYTSNWYPLLGWT
jgi:sodium/bile acid cotransporter 7